MKPRGLTEKQKRFIDFYIETGNATEAAERAGYRKRSARSVGNENLTKPDIRSAIAKRLKEAESKRVASGTEVLQYLTSVMRGEAEEEVLVTEGCGVGYTKTKAVKKKISQKDRLKAAELLMKRLGLAMSDIETEERKTRIQQMRKDIDREDGDEEGVQIINDYSETE